MQLFLQLLVLGCATGGLYALSAMGVVLVYRSSGVINFAAGAIAMVAAYTTYELSDAIGLPTIIAIVTALVEAGVIGLLMYVLIIHRISSASSLTKVIATLGVFIVIQQIVLLRFGTALRVPHSFLPTTSIRIGGVGIAESSLILLLFSIAMTLGLWWVYRSTRFGMATSAVAESPRSLAALGWPVERIRAINWTLGGVLSGVAGVALAPSLQLNPATFALLIIPTLASAILGGLRSFPLTLVGGLVLGVLQAELPYYIKVDGLGDAVPFLVIVAVLFLRGKALPLRSHIHERLPRVGSGEIRVLRLVVTCVALFVLLYYVLGLDIINGFQLSFLGGFILLSQVVVTGYAGQLSLAQLPIAGVGAIIAGRLVADYHIPFWLAILIGGAVGMLASLVVGLPSLRARGVSLAIATLGMGVAINSVILANNTLDGGAAGTTVGPQSFFGIKIDPILYPWRYAIFCGVVLLALVLVVANLRRGRAGRRLLAVRNNERAAASLGVNVSLTKLYGFVIGGGVAGIGGVLIAFQNYSLTYTSFDPLSSVYGLTQSVIGGIGYLAGVVIGGLGASGGVITAITNLWLFNFTSYLTLILGCLLIITVVTNPNGVADVIASENLRKGMGPIKRRLIKFKAFEWLKNDARARRERRIADEISVARSEQTQFRGGVLDVRGLTVTFGAVTAVDGVNVRVEPGEIVSIIGPNGAGKTTLMDAISGFVDCRGSVTLDDFDLTGLPAFRRTRRGLTRSFQSLELLEDMDVLDNLRCATDPADGASYAVDLIRPFRRSITPAAVAAIDAFGLAAELHRLPTELSYGDRHLVAIGRAVAAAPNVLMLDEPAAGLSEAERSKVGDLIQMMAKEWGMAVLLIEHDVALVRRVSDRAIVLDFGKMIAEGTPDEVLANSRVIDAYLGQPEPEEPTPVAVHA